MTLQTPTPAQTQELAKRKHRRALITGREEWSQMVQEGAGGTRRLARASGRCLIKTIERGIGTDGAQPPAHAVQAALVAVRLAQETTPKFKEDFEPTQLTPQQIREYLVPYAKQMLLNDAGFREEILSDVDVRAKLFGHEGRTLIEVPMLYSQEGPPDVR